MGKKITEEGDSYLEEKTIKEREERKLTSIKPVLKYEIAHFIFIHLILLYKSNDPYSHNV